MREGRRITEDQVKNLFGNLDKILSLAEAMLHALRERVNNLPYHHDMPVGETLLQHVQPLGLLIT